MPDSDPKAPAESKPVDLEAEGDRVVDARIYGQTKQVTLKELVAIGQKQIAADQKFEEIAQQKEELSLASQTFEDLRAGNAGDAARLERALVTAGFDKGVVNDMIYGTQEPAGDPAAGPADAAADTKKPDWTLEDLTAALEKTPFGQRVAQMHNAFQGNQQVVQQRTRKSEVHQALDSHPDLAIIMEQATPEQKVVIREMAEVAVGRRLSDFRDWGPRPIAAGLADLPAKLKALGISTANPVPHSLGDAASSKSAVHLTDATRTLLDSLKPSDDPVSVNDPGFNQSILASIAEKAAKPD